MAEGEFPLAAVDNKFVTGFEFGHAFEHHFPDAGLKFAEKQALDFAAGGLVKEDAGRDDFGVVDDQDRPPGTGTRAGRKNGGRRSRR